jgi:hypothetical protein
MKKVSVFIIGIIKDIKMSIKIEMMIDHVKEKNKDYRMISKKTITAYLRNKFKCSPYMARVAVDKLFDDD